ncbi:hypothetical protein KQI61_19145 [Anaerocolumna aminovalerica]|uniref:hypothetical protein n=1 Tax=Anaerocolumna aminovalerica TaxID=1527 RepID=UPI001C0F37DE|nr:hypothetical protein [Anaerocolumna aminovalerica]MBU5334300.1 hypothetical protein [Anaerocolumna aminovalerica]
MAKRKVKEQETKVVLQEEVIVADVVNEEEPVEVVGAVEENGLLESDTVIEENKQEEIHVATIENNSEEPVDAEVNMEDASTGAEEGIWDSSEDLSDNSEDKEVIPAVTSITFKSDSEEARHYILEFLKDGESHKKSEVVAYITNRSGKSFTEATVINVLRGMINNGSIISLERGSYQIGSGSGLLSKLVQFIEVTRGQLEKVATISVSDIKEEDYKAINELKSLKDTLNTMYERLASN